MLTLSAWAVVDPLLIVAHDKDPRYDPAFPDKARAALPWQTDRFDAAAPRRDAQILVDRQLTCESKHMGLWAGVIGVTEAIVIIWGVYLAAKNKVCPRCAPPGPISPSWSHVRRTSRSTSGTYLAGASPAYSVPWQ